jgi:Peptidase propeptide and YPEB domain
MSIKHILSGLVLAASILLPGHVLADRAPTPQERSRIENVLRDQGFTRWGRIELDDDDYLWEVDNAHASNGRTYDLKLHPDTLAIIAREPDDD